MKSIKITYDEKTQYNSVIIPDDTWQHASCSEKKL